MRTEQLRRKTEALPRWQTCRGSAPLIHLVCFSRCLYPWSSLNHWGITQEVEESLPVMKRLSGAPADLNTTRINRWRSCVFQTSPESKSLSENEAFRLAEPRAAPSLLPLSANPLLAWFSRTIIWPENNNLRIISVWLQRKSGVGQKRRGLPWWGRCRRWRQRSPWGCGVYLQGGVSNILVLQVETRHLNELNESTSAGWGRKQNISDRLNIWCSWRRFRNSCRNPLGLK